MLWHPSRRPVVCCWVAASPASFAALLNAAIIRILVSPSARAIIIYQGDKTFLLVIVFFYLPVIYRKFNDKGGAFFRFAFRPHPAAMLGYYPQTDTQT
jgi:cyanate permease